MKDYKVFCIVSLYQPKDVQKRNIVEYCSFFDKCIVIDDTGKELSIRDREAFENYRIEYISNYRNEGLCKTVNRGIKQALNEGADWIVVMDQDSIFDRHILEVYENAIKDHRYELAIIAAFTPQYNYDRHKRNISKGYKDVTVSELSGTMLNVRVLEGVGLYDERFFTDGLDYEWCLRAKKLGYRIIRCNEAVLEHNPGETRITKLLGLIDFHYGWHTPERYYYQFRAGLMLHHMYHDLYCDTAFIYKLFKAYALFENNADYKKAWQQAKEDYKAGYFGKYKENADLIRFPEIRKGGSM